MSSKILWLKRYKEKAGKTAKELDRHHATRPEGHRRDAQQLAVDRGAWRRSVAQCVFDAGWTRAQVFEN